MAGTNNQLGKKKVGPWGGPGGDPWDDGSTYTGVREINLTHKDAIGSFQVVYDLNGQPFPGPDHPSGDGTFNKVNIKLAYPDEVLQTVSGYTGTIPTVTQTDVVRSLTFTTSKGNKYGPYGPEQGTAFNVPIESGKFVSGFFGRTGPDFLHAIGFYLSG